MSALVAVNEQIADGDLQRVWLMLDILNIQHPRYPGIAKQVLSIPGNPLPLERSRGRGGQPTPYLTPRSRKAKAAVGLAVQASRIATAPVTGNVALAVIFYREKRLKVDVDNLVKLVMDAITDTRQVWVDDSQVTGLTAVIEHDPVNPRTVIGLAPHTSSLERHLVPIP